MQKDSSHILKAAFVKQTIFFRDTLEGFWAPKIGAFYGKYLYIFSTDGKMLYEKYFD
jgi:hypothetical protein